jgi:hypothetical protein
MKTGTRIELPIAYPGIAPEQATIARWTKKSGPREAMPGWHIVKFADGGKLLVHESGFCVINNR